MEEEGRASCCCARGEAGLLRGGDDALIRLLLQSERRARAVAAALLLLLCGALALLFTGAYGGGRRPADSQPVMQPSRHSSGVDSRRQEDQRNPSAMLTAPRGKNLHGRYLDWEQDDGQAFCHGGFLYSNGSLLVPRGGVYRVFLQITYESRADTECDEQLRLSNSVLLVRDHYRTPVALLSSVDSVSCSLTQWSKTLYTAGLFSLEELGELHVSSSHPHLIVEAESKVFFGAELLVSA
ncbi:lymphotoxin-alpha-like [Pseudoliparis swirei]|uniref:lymphotoxin-alpha-like n=1 Tax=Pseudoliparis swirei TaxID=2059687 RepID=UPI0024BDFE5E|nr:lymphotoxin-alpha-like [Pseudoliparis swirei]